VESYIEDKKALNQSRLERNVKSLSEIVDGWDRAAEEMAACVKYDTEDKPTRTAHQRNEVQLELPFEPPLDRVMARAKVLRTAEKYVCKDRAAQHGDMEDNFQTIAKYWGVHLGTEVTATDVAVMMTLLKVARIKGNEAHADNWVDGCGYLACGGELAGGDVE
tara:strand:+ start:1120 stop:1608 length:489 start_codon:yes stop_codon:yes gene_type:complete